MEKISYIHSPTIYSYHYQTIPERLEYQAKLLGDKEIYVFVKPDGRRVGVTTQEVYQQSLTLARSFVKLGIRKGDIIALCLPNDVSGMISLFGVILSGAIVLNVISAKEDGSDLKNVLFKVGAKALIIHPGDSSSSFKARMNFIDDFDTNGNAKSTAVPSLRFFVTSAAVENHAYALTLDNLLSSSDITAEPPKLDASDICTLFPTSGSTGESKFVPMSHFAAMVIGHQLHESIQYDPDDIIYTERRFAWIGGFPFTLLHNGVKVITKTSAIRTMEEHCRFTLDVLLKENCTHACLFPATIIGLSDLISKTSNESLMLEGIHTGALPVASVCYFAIGNFTKRMTNCYGSSEAGFITSLHVTHTDQYELDYNTGSALQGVEVKIIDEQGYLVTRGETGAIHVRSPSMFNEYYHNKQKTNEVLSTSCWFNTDDTGIINNSGELIVTGRQSDIILQGGKVYVPSVIEGLIKTHPDVLDVIVVPVPDEVLFQLVCACIMKKPGTKLQAEDVREFYKSKFMTSANEAFGGFIPRLFLMFDEYPRLYTGKPDKMQLTTEAIRRKGEV